MSYPIFAETDILLLIILLFSFCDIPSSVIWHQEFTADEITVV